MSFNENYKEYKEGFIYPYFLIKEQVYFKFCEKSEINNILLYSKSGNNLNIDFDYAYIIPTIFNGVENKKQYVPWKSEKYIYRQDFNFTLKSDKYSEALSFLFELDSEENIGRRDSINKWREIYEKEKDGISNSAFASYKVNYYRYKLPFLKRVVLDKKSCFCPECLGFGVIPRYFGIGPFKDGSCYKCEGSGKIEWVKKCKYDFNTKKRLAMYLIIQYDVKYDDLVFSYINSPACKLYDDLHAFLLRNDLPLLERWFYYFLGKENGSNEEDSYEDIADYIKELLSWWKVYYNEFDNYDNILNLKEKIKNNNEEPNDEKIFKLFVYEGYEFVKSKLEDDFDLLREEEYNEDSYVDENGTDWSNYNDDLDMDQQSEDFWNQF
jgi:hypothetical protein